MLTKNILLCFLGMFGLMSLHAQCRENKILWERIALLRDHPPVSVDLQLEELEGYKGNLDKGLAACKIDSAFAFLLQRIGVMHYLKQEYELAVEYTGQAIALIRKYQNSPAINKYREINCYRNLGIYYDSLNLIEKKSEALDSAIAIAVRYKQIDYSTLIDIERKTDFLCKIGDFQECINAASEGELLARQNGLAGFPSTIGIFTYRMNSLLYLHQFEEVRKDVSEKIIELQKGANKQFLGTMYGLLATWALKTKDYHQAIIFYTRSYESNRKVSHLDGCSEALNNIGFVYSEYLKQFPDALNYYRKALPFANVGESMNILSNIGNVHAKQHHFDSALYFFQAAFDKIRKGIHESEIVSNSKVYLNSNVAEYIIDLLSYKADAFVTQYLQENQQKYLDEALLLYGLTDQLVNKIKTEQSELVSRLFWRDHSRRIYEQAISASFLAKDYDHAFYFFEKSRAVLLNDQLDQNSRIAKSEMLVLAQIKKSILRLEQERNQFADTSLKYAAKQNEVFARQRELGRAEGLLKLRYPLLYQDIERAPFITRKNVRQTLLKDHEGLLELFEGDSAVYSLLLTVDSSYFKKINKMDLDSTTGLFTSYISNIALLNRKHADYVKIAKHLYELIFQGEPLPLGRLIISPDGPYFPFEALVVGFSGRDPLYFLNDHAVSYTYSARFLMSDFGDTTSVSAERFLGIAPVHFPATPSLPSLPGSEESLNRIGHYFNRADQLIGPKASKKNFLGDYAKYRIIQLYTHSSDNSLHGEPVIFFADDPLYLSELIADQRPLTRLVVLAACETGKGQLYKGEGVFSFNRAFAAMGIPASLTNLWAIDSKSTYELTELFYKFVSEGMPSDIALQKAKLRFMKSYSGEEKSLPYYWAATILAGKTEVLAEKGHPGWYYLAGFAGLAAALLLIWIYRRRGKK